MIYLNGIKKLGRLKDLFRFHNLKIKMAIQFISSKYCERKKGKEHWYHYLEIDQALSRGLQVSSAVLFF